MVQTVEVVYENGLLRPLHAIANLQEGQRALVTVKPIEALDAPEVVQRHSALVQRMETAGMIEHPQRPSEAKPDAWCPLVLPGEPLSETILHMRREE